MLKQDLRCTPRFCPVDRADALVFSYPFHFHGYRQLKEKKRNLNKLLNLTGYFEFLSKVAVFETTWNIAKSPWEQGLGRALYRGREDAILSVVIVYFCHPHTLKSVIWILDDVMAMIASAPGTSGKRKEIYKYDAPWTIYGMNWSVRPDKRFRLALGSFVEEYNNKVWSKRRSIYYGLLIVWG